MSEAALKVLADYAGDATADEAQTPTTKAIAALSERAAGKSFAQPAPRKWPLSDRGGDTSDIDISRAEPALHIVSNLGGKVVGGIGGIGSLLLGQGSDQAADVSNWWEQALTYEPRTPHGQELTQQTGEVMNSPYNPLSWVGKTGEYGAAKAEEAGWSPGMVTTMRMAPEVIAALAGGSPKVTGASVAADARTAGTAIRRTVMDESPMAETNPFASESLGAAAVSPELKAASPELRAEVARATAAGEKVDRVALDRRLEAESLPIPMKLTKGQASQDAEQISHEMNRRGQDPKLLQAFAEHNQQLIDNLDEIRAGAAPNAVGNDHIQNGQALIDAYKAHDEAVSADIAQKYKALRDANGGDFPVDGPAFVKSAEAALKKGMKGRYVPPEIAADLEEFRSGAMTFENFENLRTNLASAARKAERGGDGNAAAAIRIVRDSLEDLPITGETAKLKPLADAARKAAKARFDRLRKDPAYKAAVDDSVAAGEASPLADDFIHRYVVKGKAANIGAMRETLAADETVSETIAAGALNYVKSKSGVNLYTNEGNFSQAGYNRALSELTPKLNQLLDPKTAEQMQTLGNVARYTQAQPRGSFVNNSNTTVSALAEHGKNLLEKGVNAVAYAKGVPVPVGTFARNKLAARAGEKFTREALHPASGITKRGEK